MKKSILKLISVLLLIVSVQDINAQYFGQNKVKYKKFDFKVVKSKTFDIYHYLDKDSLIIGLAKDAEKWRKRHQVVFRDTFSYKVPIIFYNNHGDFQQTSVVGGLIGTTTGGVTEGLKNRVTLPLTPSYTQTDHVLGHELVHAHQYNLFIGSDSLSFKNMGNIPLWMTEGMAEYLSIGSIDEPTAMWMRDAVANDFFPRIRDLYKPRYFPYRFGQAFWAFVGGSFGDDKIYSLYKETAKIGVKEAFKRELGMPTDSFSTRWKTTTENYYKPLMKGRDLKALGTKLIDAKNGGRLNISPAISPDGKYFIFLSEKNIFTLDLFLGEVATGKIIKKLSTRTRNSHLDALDAFESSGTWSPDSKQYAFIIYSKGQNKVAIADIDRNKVIDEFFIPNIPSFNNIAWSPNGKKLLFSGLKEGQSDLYTIDITTKKVTQLTNDYFAQMQPRWSKDGNTIIFVTDHLIKKQVRPNKNLSFALFDVKTHKITVPDVFTHSNNLNPIFSKDASEIFFISDREGFRDLYKYDITTKKVYQLTRFFTGISGITKFSPAVSLSVDTNDLLYSFYNDSKYALYKVNVADLQAKEVAVDEEDTRAAKLPSLNLKKSFVDVNLVNEDILTDMTKLKEEIYTPKFKLDYISNGGLGVATGRYGTGMAGGINMLFGDMLNDNQMYIAAVLNGELQDFGAQVAYLNRKSRYAWGGGVSHIPYRYDYGYYENQDENINGYYSNLKYTRLTYRIFNEGLSAFTYYPFSKATRVELGGAFNYYSFRLTQDIYDLYYDGFYEPRVINYSRERNIKIADAFGIASASLAYVGDDSSFGLTAPMNGYRYRFEVQQSLGKYNTTSLLGDARKYFYTKPVAFAFRGYYYSNVGEVVDNPLNYPLYLGYGNLIRGYTYTSLDENTNDLTYNDLLGSQVSIGSFEVRLPFTGPERLAAVKSGFLFTDLNLFFDAGVVWGDYRGYDPLTQQYVKESRTFDQSQIITSAGLSMRINLFGQLILEPYYAIPFQLDRDKTGVFGLNFSPGW